MSANFYYDNITKYLHSLADQASHGNALGLTNTAVHAENLFAEMLEIIFGWKLVNANEANRNQDTFDLINDKKNLVVQVTTNKKYKAKYDKTISGLASKARPKVKRLIIIFLTKKLPASIPTNGKLGRVDVDTYDVKRLLDAVFFKVRSPKKLKALNDLLEFSTLPVALGHMDPPAALVAPHQELVLRRTGIYIQRPALLDRLFDFSQENDGLLVGGPGFGKSFLLEELQEKYYSLGLGCVLIRINELTEGTDKEVGAELHSDERWLEALKRLPFTGDYKALVIFDAYDTAKDERLKSNILRQIRRCIAELKDHCRVLVSVRTYDATRSRKLQELFPHQVATASVRCRFLEITELTNAELNSALSNVPAIRQIASHCSPALQRLLHTPYFLKLFEQMILDNGLHSGKLFSGIETEGQLLEVYWRLFVEEDAGSALLAGRITRALAEREALVIALTEVVDQGSLVHYEQLVSNGVLVTSGSMGNKIGFTHNILLDFGIAKFMLDDDPAVLTDFLRTHEKLPFVFRQSFLYFYTHLYKNHNPIYWRHYHHFVTIEEPLFRLLHQTSLNYVLISFYKTVQELMPVFDGPKNDAQGNRVRKLLETVRFITKGRIRIKDLSLLHYATSNMHWLYLWETGNLLDQAITIYLETDGIQQGKLLSEACADYLEVVLTERVSFEHKYLVDRNGGRFAVRNLCRTMVYNKKRGRGLIKRLLELLNEEDFPISFFHDLSDQMLQIFRADGIAASFAFTSMYLHQEISDKQTTMGSNVTMSFISNRKQDYGLVHFRLEKVYGEMLRYDFVPAMKMGIEVVNKKNDYRRNSWPLGRANYRLEVGTIATGLDENHDFFEHLGDRGPEGVLNQIFKVLEELKNIADGEQVFDTALKAMISVARSSNIWRRILRLLTTEPAKEITIICDLLMNGAFYASDETRYETGELLKAAWPFFQNPQREAIEATILDLGKIKILAERGIADLRISMMLGCVPDGDWSLERSRRFIAEHGTQDNYSVMRDAIAARVYNPTREEKMQRSGFDPKVAAQAGLYDQVAEIEQFNNRYQNIKDEIEPEIFRPLFPKVEKLYADAAKWKGDIRRNAEYEVAQFISNISSADVLTEQELAFCGEVSVSFLTAKRYNTPKYEQGELRRTSSSYSPNARTASIHTCSNMMIGTKGATIYLDALEAILGDNSQTIRFLGSRTVRGIWHYDRQRFWRIMNDRIAKETDGMPLGELLNNICYSNIIKSDINGTKACVKVAIRRLQHVDNEKGRELWSIIAVILINFTLRHDREFGREVITEYLALDALAHSLIFQITTAIDPHSFANDYEQDGTVYDVLFEILAEIVETRFFSISNKKLSDPAVAADLSVIDHLIEHLNIVTTAGKANARNTKLTPPIRAAFYLKLRPLLDLIVERSTNIASGFMVAHTGYNFMQLLNFMIDEDPEHILRLANKIVQYAAKNGFTYDNSTLGEIVQLTDALIADHKQVLYKTENFNQLIVILDLFANSGWQDALELTWQLKDAF